MSDNESVRTITEDGNHTAVSTINPPRMLPPEPEDEIRIPRPTDIFFPPIR